MGCLGYPVPGPHIQRSPSGPHKIFNKLNLLLDKAQWLYKPCWLVDVSSTYFKETTTPLFNVHLSCFVDFILWPTDKYMFKVNIKKIWLICWMC